MAEQDVTTGELYRLIQSMDKKLDTMRAEMVGRAEYESDQEHINSRFEESGKVHVQLETRVAEVNAARKVAVTEEATEREKAVARLETRIDRIGGWVKWGGSAAITVILAVLGFLLANGGGP